MPKVRIIPSQIGGTIVAPSSKSYAQRALTGALLASGTTVLRNVTLCDDVANVLKIVRNLGATVRSECSEIDLVEEVKLIDSEVTAGSECSEINLGIKKVELTDCEIESRKTLNIIIKGGISPQHPLTNILNIGESGLAARLFTPIMALLTEPITIVGEGSILSRPIGMMKRPLEQLGAKFNDTDGFLPLVVEGPIRGGEITLDGSDTSQFMTGLLTALPLAYGNSVIKVKNLKSIAYVDMTVAMLKLFGVDVSHEKYETVRINGGQTYRPIDYSIEGDWSGASCMLVAGAIAGEVTVGNLNSESIQPDRVIVEILKEVGAEVSCEKERVMVRKASLKCFSFDATNCPDLFPALVVLAAYCEGRSTIIGTKRLIHKESNRMVALVEEFEKLGVRIDISIENTMTVEGRKSISGNIEGNVSGSIGKSISTDVSGNVEESILRNVNGSEEGDVVRSILDIGNGIVSRIVAENGEGDIVRSIPMDALKGVEEGVLEGAEKDALDGVEVDSRGDHRMAMALAVFALNCDCEVVVNGAESVSKSYPEFWRDLARITKK